MCNGGTTLSARSMPLLLGVDLTREGPTPPSRMYPRGASDPSSVSPAPSDPAPGRGTDTAEAAVALTFVCHRVATSHQISTRFSGIPWEAVWKLPASEQRTTNNLGSDAVKGVDGITGYALGIWTAPIERHHGGP